MASISRRAALASGAGILALAAWETGGEEAAEAAPRGRTALLREHSLHRKHYQPHVGKVFRAHHGGSVHRVRLVAIEDHGVGHHLRNLSFTLVFKPVGRHRLPDQIYTLRRPGVPTRALLLTSLGTAGRLQAVINSAH